MRLRALYCSGATGDAADVAEALALGAVEELPDRVFVFGEAGLAIAQHLAEQRRTSDEGFIDAAAAFLLEEQRGSPPVRPAAPTWLERLVVITEDGAGLMELTHAMRGLELLGRIVVMAAPSKETLDVGERINANVWLLGGGDAPEFEQDDTRLLLSPGDLLGAGGVLDVEIRRGVVTAVVTKAGEPIARLEHQLRASTKMSVQG